MIRRVVLLLGLAALLGGCVNTAEYEAYREEYDGWPYYKKVGVAVKDLVLDYGDVVSVESGAGEGFLAHVQATKIAELGGGYANTVKVLYDRRAAGFVSERRKEGGIGPVYYRSKTFEPITGTAKLVDEVPRTLDDFTIRHNEDSHWLDIGAGLHVVFVGADVRVSPKEIFDAVGTTITFPYTVVLRPVLSWFNISPPELDFAEDDTAAQLRRKHRVILVEQDKGFEPAETVNDWIRIPY